ncbi:diacylglycerol kinase family protein [Winogradskyella ludwigii]|jgi:diacylglycerol kinase (ATP)|uniref:diacylglycerol kinase family protein n=1 Tax=Winogradskyella ludwigii TaxID=2686076 RepID=UPI0015CCA4A4|nr:diacylglycerol kinase family protein [Winogradskyella ludwigii]
MPEKESFILNRIKSVGFAFKGMFILIRTEASIKVQLFIALVVTIAGFYFDISKTEWIAQITMIGLVMSVEGMNTAIEAIADFIHPEYHEKIGLIKDVAAGAVFIASVIAVIIAGIIYIPKF